MTRDEMVRIASERLMGWQDDSFSWSYDIADAQAAAVVDALIAAGCIPPDRLARARQVLTTRLVECYKTPGAADGYLAALEWANNVLSRAAAE